MAIGRSHSLQQIRQGRAFLSDRTNQQLSGFERELHFRSFGYSSLKRVGAWNTEGETIAPALDRSFHIYNVATWSTPSIPSSTPAFLRNAEIHLNTKDFLHVIIPSTLKPTVRSPRNKLAMDKLLPALLSALLLCSCSTYITPGRQADLSTFTDPKVKKAYTAKPALQFPANIALVRVQASGYRSESVEGVGTGAYSVVTTRDVETEQDIDRLSKLPGITAVTTLNRLLLPKALASDLDIREAAAKLQADAILLYTIDTEFRNNEIIPPLTAISLGLLPNNQFKITSTASALLMDTKTGFIYGALEENDLRSGLTVPILSTSALEGTRKKAERAAFEKMTASFEPFWARIYNRYHK